MEFKNLDTFIRVAELENFSKAAEELGYSQSSVTSQIQQLEQQLKTKLFDRNGKKVKLSTAGKKFLEYGYRIRQIEAEAASCFLTEQEPDGILRIGIMESVCSSVYDSKLTDFMLKYPHVNMKVLVCTTFEAIEFLQKGELDVIITLDHRIVRPGWKTSYLKHEDIVFICSADHPLLKKKKILVEDLINEDFLMVEEKCNYREAFEQEMQQRGHSVKCRLEIGHSWVIVDAVAKGVGISILPKFTAEEALNSGIVRQLKLSDYKLQMDLQVIYDESRWKSPALNAFLDMWS